MTDPELDVAEEFEDEDTLEYLFADDEEEDFEDTTWEWDGTQWKQVA